MIARSAAFAALFAIAFAASGCGKPDEPAAEDAQQKESATPVSTGTAASVSPGKRLFDKNCAACHAPGDDHPGYMQLAATRGEQFAVLEEREDLTADYVKYIVRHGLNGMPPFKPTVITDEELETLADYLSKVEAD